MKMADEKNILSNDDIQMELSDLSDLPDLVENDVVVEDKTPPAYPIVKPPIAVDDETNRSPDGWMAIDRDYGSQGIIYDVFPPIEHPDLEPPTYKTIVVKERYTIDNFDQNYLKDLADQGGQFYALYDDGTEDPVSYTEIFDPAVAVSEIIENEAVEIAEAINQHFWYDDNGAHVTDETQDEWFDAIADDFSDGKAHHNILINSLGLLLRTALNNLVSLSKSAIAFYDGLGNSAGNILASFGKYGIQLRSDGKNRVDINRNGLSVYDDSGTSLTNGAVVASIGINASGNPYSKIGRSDKGNIVISTTDDGYGYIDINSGSNIMTHIGYGDVYDLATNDPFDPSMKIVQNPYYSFGSRSSTKYGVYSMAIGHEVESSAISSFANGYKVKSTLPFAFSHGFRCQANGYGTISMGTDCINNGYYSFMEGYNNTGYAWSSACFGHGNTMGENQMYGDGHYGSWSLVSGYNNVCNIFYGLCIGRDNRVGGFYGGAIGRGLKFGGSGLAIGQYNTDTNGFIIGGGSSDSSRYDRFKVNSGGVYVFGSLVHSSSDIRVKTDIERLDPYNSSEFIKLLKPSSYLKDGVPELGFIAQEIEVIKGYGYRLVSTTKNGKYDDYRLLNYEGLIAPTVSALQYALDKIDKLENEIVELKKSK